MRSMTGFGRGVAEHGGVSATVDVRAVNHRFLDLKVRGGTFAPALEEAIGARVRGSIERGAVTVSVRVVRDQASTGTRIDPAAARAAHASLSELARTLGVAGPELALVLAQPGVVVASDEERDDDGPAILAALDGALAQLVAMREAEGEALARELIVRLDELGGLRGSLAKYAADVPAQINRRLHERLRKLLGDDADRASDAAIDPNRLAQEIASLADRADVTEELVRLASHLEQGRALVGAPAASGRRLDFLTQEIGRELNTIGSKSALAEISSLIVDAKAVLEKVREQVQNVE